MNRKSRDRQGARNDKKKKLLEKGAGGKVEWRMF